MNQYSFLKKKVSVILMSFSRITALQACLDI